MQIQTSWTQRVARTQAIMSAAWQILREDKTLLLLPIASSACLMLLTASFAVPAILEALTGASVSDELPQAESLSYVDIFLFYVVTYGVAIFFNAALAICVLGKLEGKQATMLDGLREALSCFPQILGWAVVSATIGVILKAIERRSGFVGNMVARVLGLAWSVATFLVVPVLVAERKGPLEAVQESVQLLRRTWGEDLLAGLGFGLLYFFWAIPGVFAFIIGAGMIAFHPNSRHCDHDPRHPLFSALRPCALHDVDHLRRRALPLCQIRHDHTRLRPRSPRSLFRDQVSVSVPMVVTMGAVACGYIGTVYWRYLRKQIVKVSR